MKKTKIQSYASDYCMRGSDNAVSRDQINASIISKATANEGEYAKALTSENNNNE